jgi:tetratricopeptide (TPR) repeat protein
VADTFGRQFNLLNKESHDIGNLLKVLSFFNPENIPVEMIIDGAEKWLRSRDEPQPIPPQPIPPPSKSTVLQKRKKGSRPLRRKGRDTKNQPEDVIKVSSRISSEFRSLVILILSPIKFRNAIRSLQNLSLVDYRSDTGNSSLWVHDLVQLMVQHAANKEDTYREWLQSSVSLVCGAFQKVEDPESPQQWDECERFMPHFRSLNQRTNSLRDMNLELIRAIKAIGVYLWSLGRYDEAEVLCKQVFGFYEVKLGCEDWNTLDSMNNLALVYDSQGRYGEAEELYKRVVAVREKVLGADHPSTLTSIHNLASVYDSQGRYSEAEELFKLALSCQEKCLGIDHPNTLTMAENLAKLYQSQGRFSEAESVGRKYIGARREQADPRLSGGSNFS